MPSNKTYQNNNNILGQSPVNLKSQKVFNMPDTDAREITITGSNSTIDINMAYDHAFIKIQVPISSPGSFTVNPLINADNRTLLRLEINNTSVSTPKTFNFAPSYIFLDANSGSPIIVGAGKVQIWYGTVIDNKVYLRVESDSTNN